MAKLEKKYKVSSFDTVLDKIKGLDLDPPKVSSSVHYYAPMRDGLVTKLVQDSEGVRITQLKDIKGTFEFVRREYVDSLEAGLAWMRSNGFTSLKEVTMHSTMYPYKDGHVELIKINDDALFSVILYFEPSYHASAEKVFGLEAAETIEVPYSELV